MGALYPAKPTALYRFFDSEDRLLYVGITMDIKKRWASHEATKPWWHKVSRKTTCWFGSRELAVQAELDAIREERPVHNVASSPWGPKPRVLGVDEMLPGQLRKQFDEALERVQSGATIAVVDRTRARKPQAVVVSTEFFERAVKALGAGV